MKSKLPFNEYPLNVGHRGFARDKDLLENTLPAFIKALELGATAIELDVHQCKSGEMVVIHDPTVDGSFKGTGKVADLTLDQLRALEPRKGEARIATLEQVLDELKGRCKEDGFDPMVFIEMKSSGGKKVAKIIKEAVEKKGWEYDKLPVISFNPLYLRTVKCNNPQIQTGLSFSEKHVKGGVNWMMRIARRMVGASAINPEHSLITSELVEEAHRRGLKVNSWTVNKEEDIRRVRNAGVDAIMGDDPHLIQEVLEEPLSQQVGRAR